jgi:hypothetical protein
VSLNKANTEELKEKLRSIDIEKQLKEQDLTVDQLWNNFKEKVLDIMNQSGLILASTYTISWSDIPGITSTLLISELLLVKNKSRMDLDFSVK